MYIDKDNTKALTIINDENTSFEKLQELLVEFHGDIKVAEAVARHPNCSKNLMGRMLYYQLDAVKDNPNYPEYANDKKWMNEYYVDLTNKKRVADKYSYFGWEKTYKPESYGVCQVNTELFKVQCLVKYAPPKKALEALDKFPNVPESFLSNLASDKAAKIRVLVAKSKNITSELSLQLAKDKLKSVRLELAKNSHASAEVLTILSADKLDDVQAAALANPNCPRQVSKEIRAEKKKKKALSGSEIINLPYKDKVGLLLDQNTKVDVLEKFIIDESPIIRYLSGYHPSIDDNLAEKLLQDPIDWVQESVAYNKYSSSKMLCSLVDKNKPHLNRALACNRSLDKDSQLKLLKNLSLKGSYLDLANSARSREVLQAIADIHPQKLPKTHWVTKLRDALSSKAKGKSLSQMLRQKNYRYRWLSTLLLMRDDCPGDMLEYFNYYCPEEMDLNKAVALRLLESPSSLRKSKFQDWKIQKWLSERYAPAYVSHHYLKIDQVKEKRQAAGGVFSCIADFQTLVFNPDTLVRKRLAERDDLPNFMWYALANDDKETISKAVASSKHCPKKILSSLSDSKNTAVSMAARKSASKRGVSTQASVDDLDLKKLRKKERLEVALTSSDSDKQLLLAQDRLIDVRIKLLENRSLDQGTLSHLLSDSNPDVRAAVAAHRIYGNKNFEALSNDPEAIVRASLANNYSCVLSEVLKSALVADKDSQVRLVIVKRVLPDLKHLKEEMGQSWIDNYIEQAIRDPAEVVREYIVKKHLRTLTEQHQLFLCDDQSKEIRSHLAEESRIVSAGLKLLEDPEEEIRTIATNSYLWKRYNDELDNYHPEFLNAIKNSDDTIKKHYYAKYGDDVNRIEELLQDDNEKVRLSAMQSKHFSSEHEQLVLDKGKDESILNALGRYTKSRKTFDQVVSNIEQDYNPNTFILFRKADSVLDNKLHWSDEDFQEKFCQHPNIHIRKKITRQKNLNLKTAQAISRDEDREVRRYLAERCVYPSVLRTMLNDEDPRVLRHIFVNEHCDEDMQKHIYARCKESKYEAEIIDNAILHAFSIEPQVMDEKAKLLEKIMEETTIPEIFLELFHNDFETTGYLYYLNDKMLENPVVQKSLVTHPNSEVREFIARQEYLAEELRKILLKDGNKNVAQSAKRYGK